MQITWDGKTSTPPRVLRKKSVSFPPEPFLSPVEEGGYPPTPDTPDHPKKPSWIKRGILKLTSPPSSPHTHRPIPHPPSPTPSNHSNQSWHHHPSYFPEYTPLFPKHTETFQNPYAEVVPLSTAELQAQSHSGRVGHSVVIHYPMLPSFAEYNSKPGGVGGGGATKSGKEVKPNGPGWQSTRWGTEGWTGFGWEGEKLPTVDGAIFGVPMVPGVAQPHPDAEGGGGKKKKKKKNKKKGGGGGGRGGGGKKKEGDDDDNDDDDGDGDGDEGGDED